MRSLLIISLAFLLTACPPPRENVLEEVVSYNGRDYEVEIFSIGTRKIANDKSGIESSIYIYEVIAEPELSEEESAKAFQHFKSMSRKKIEEYCLIFYDKDSFQNTSETHGFYAEYLYQCK